MTSTATTSTAAMTNGAGGRLIVNGATGTCSFDDRAGAEFRAQEAECERRRAVYAHRDSLVRSGLSYDEADAACEARLAGVAAEYEAAMGRIAAKYADGPQADGRAER